MKLAISNIAWDMEKDGYMYELMNKYGFAGLEIAPTRVFAEKPYEKIEEAKTWKTSIENKYGISIPSMQSIWYGRQESIFGSEEEKKTLIKYTKKAVDFASAIECKNLVFGCPKNRNVPEGENEKSAISFFKELGAYAVSRGTVIGMEANPTIYNTNFINTTSSALELIEKVNSDGFKLNLDVGTMVQNEESVWELVGKVHLINHVHISEPYLKPIKQRILHKEIRHILLEEKYEGFISIEMGKVEKNDILEERMAYLSEVFG